MPVNKDSFWKRADEDPLEASPSFEFVSSQSSSKEVPPCYHSYITPSHNHKDMAGFVLNPRSILQMRVAKAKVPRVKSSSNLNHKVIIFRYVGNKLLSTLRPRRCWREAWRRLWIWLVPYQLNRRHRNLEFLVSQWSTESHILVTVLGEISYYTWRYLCFDNDVSIGNTHAMGVVLDEHGKEKLKFSKMMLFRDPGRSVKRYARLVDSLFWDKEGEECPLSYRDCRYPISHPQFEFFVFL